MFCWSCGTQIPDKVKFCWKCGKPQRVADAQSSSADIKNLMTLARTAQESENYPQAHAYYTRALESDPTNYEAWLGKGICAGWQSSWEHIRVPELIACLGKALEFAPADVADAYRRLAGAQINNIAVALHDIATATFARRMTLESYQEFGERASSLVALYRTASLYNPGDVMPLKNLVTVVTQSMRTYNAAGNAGKLYTTGRTYSNAKRISQETEKAIRKSERSYRARIPPHDRGR
jgi:tetratricopeptide (TPR) repeat protein